MKVKNGYKLEEFHDLYAVPYHLFSRYEVYKIELEDSGKDNGIEVEFECELNCGIIGGDYYVVKEEVYNDICKVLDEYT